MPCSLDEPNQVSKGVAARYPINIFLTYTKAGVRQHTLEPFLLGTMMQTVMLNLDHLSPFGVRLLVSTPIVSVCLNGQMQEQMCALQLLSFVTCYAFCVRESCLAHHSLLKPKNT